jgi:Ribbon-helix-helix protein, copG family
MTKKDKDESRFENLFKVARSQPSESAAAEPEQAVNDSDRQLAKHKNPDYQRTTLYLPKAIHRKLKAAAAESDREMSDIMEELVEQWLESRINI